MQTGRRDFLKIGVVGGVGAALAMPAFARRAYAKEPIKIGLPTVLSGGNAQYGIQARRACELFGKEINAKGGVLGRPLEFIYEDTGGDPATAVRKAQKLVEKDGVKFLTGTVLRGRFALRACVLHYGTTEGDIDALVETVRETGALLARES